MNNNNLQLFVQAVDYNQQALEELKFAIEMSQGQFSLVLAKCNYTVLRDGIKTKLSELCPNIQELNLEPSVTKLYSKIQEIQGDQQLPGLVIYGLESVQNIEQLLLSLNPVREEFRKNCHFAIVLWINDDIIRLFKRLIPDFESWTTKVDFTIPADLLVTQLKHNAQILFGKILELGANSQFVPNDQLFSSDQRLEIAAARRNLEDQGHELDLALRASIEFAQGRELNRKNEIDTALAHYQRSLELWEELAQEIKNLEQQKLDYSSASSESEIQTEELQYLPLKHAVLLFYIGLCHSRKAELFYNDTTGHWQQAKQYFQQTLDIFEEQQRLDLVAKFIFPYQKILEQLQSWDELKEITKKVQKLHQTYHQQVELAQDYAFLAEIALNKNDAVQGKSLIEQALSILDTQETEQDRGWYWFLLGKAQRQLKEIENAVASLKNAKKSDPYKNPQLYLDIVQELHDIYYFDKHEYLQAFELKEEQRYLRSQLGITAFVGAGRLQASIRLKYQQRKSDKKEQIPQEIAASGRQYDIEQLVSRIGSTQHKLTIIHGQSGVGKSSLVNAGLVPVLQSQSIGTLDVLPIILRAYTDWVKELGNSCQKALEEKDISGSLVLDSTQTIINQLEQNVHHNLLTVIIFDQFEEFFFVSNDLTKRKDFFDFLSQLLNIKNSGVKIILSLREDYLHYLLICNRLENMTAINNDILNKNILYHLGNFSPENAKEVIARLSQSSQFHLEPELIDYMVAELAKNLGEVRPIEMQVMGAQMQAEGITTLAKYRTFGTKEKLVQNYLANVIEDCGLENKQLAEDVLYLLTDDNNTRPLKTREEIETELKTLISDLVFTEEQLNLVLEIFIKSGLVFLIPEHPANRYQIVHDYLVAFIRQQRGDDLHAQLKDLSAKLKEEIEKRKKSEEEVKRISLQFQLEEEREKRKKSEAELNQVLKQQLKIVGASGALMGVLGIFAGVFGVQANIGQTNAELREMSAKSETIYTSGKKFDGLVEGIRGGKKLRGGFGQFGVENDTRNQVIARLQETVYGLDANNQLEGHTKPITDVKFSPDANMIASASEDKTIRLWKSDGTLIKTLEGNIEEVQTINFSPDSKLLVSGSKDGKIKLWQIDGKNSKELQINFAGHNDKINDIRFSPDGKLIATASSDSKIKIWNLDGKLFKTLTGHKSDVNSLIFSHDGKWIATASGDNTIKLWNLDGKELKFLDIPDSSSFLDIPDSSSFMFSPNNKMLMVVTRSELQFWNLDGKLIKSVDLLTNKSNLLINKSNLLINYEISFATFSSDGQRLLMSEYNGMTLWKIKDNLQLRKQDNLQLIKQDIRLNNYDDRSKLILNQKLEKVAVIRDKSNIITLKNLNSESFKTKENDRDRGSIVGLNPDNLLISIQGNLVKFWNLDGTSPKPPFIKVSDKITQVNLNNDGKILAAASPNTTVKLFNQNGDLIKYFDKDIKPFDTISDDNKTIKFWDRNSPLTKTIPLTDIFWHRNDLTDIYNPVFDCTASLEKDNTIKLWNSEGKEIATLKGHEKEINQINFSPDGKTLISVDKSKTVKLWSSIDGKQINSKTITGHGNRGSDIKIKINPDNQSIAVFGDYYVLKVWDSQGKLLTKINGYSDSFSFSPDGKTIASASYDQDTKKNTIILWNIPKNEIIGNPWNGHTEKINSISFSPDSKTIATASDDNTVQLWDLDGTKKLTLTGHSSGVNKVIFSPDSKTIATASDDNTVQLWGLDGKEKATLKGHSYAVTNINFSPDGQMIFSVDGEKNIKIWSLEGKLLKSFDRDTLKGSDVRFTSDGQKIIAISNEYNGTNIENKVLIWSLQLDELLKKGCGQVRNYLKTNPNVKNEDRDLCDDISGVNQK